MCVDNNYNDNDETITLPLCACARDNNKAKGHVILCLVLMKLKHEKKVIRIINSDINISMVYSERPFYGCLMGGSIISV